MILISLPSGSYPKTSLQCCCMIRGIFHLHRNFLQGEIRSEPQGSLAPGGMLMAMVMWIPHFDSSWPLVFPAVFSQLVLHSLFWYPMSFELFCLESEIVQLVFSSKGCIRPGVFQRNALTYVVEILTAFKCQLISSPLFQAWSKSSKHLLSWDEMSYKFSMVTKKNKWVKLKSTVRLVCAQSSYLGLRVRSPLVLS